MDLQKLFEAIDKTASSTRSKYHMTLGEFVDALRSAGNAQVRFDDEQLGYPSKPQSYRGYYSDLSFPPSTDKISAKKLLKMAENAIGDTFEGYKGGDFVMTEETPLWVSHYGSSSGIAIMGLRNENGVLVIETRQVD